MPFDPNFYRAPPPSDLSRQFSDYSAATPASGALMAARALRESLEKRTARLDRIAEIEGDRNFQRETQTRQENFQRGRDIFQYESQRLSDKNAAEIQRGHDIASIERESLQQSAANARANATAQAQVAKEERESQDKIDEQRAFGAAQSVLSSIRTQENPFFRRVSISPAQLLHTNKTEDEIVNELFAGAKDARPYLQPEGETALKGQLKDFMKGREVELYNPAAFGNLSILVTNGALDQLGTREISLGMQLGIARALNETIKSMPADEHTAALAMEAKFRDDLGGTFKNLVGTPAPAANQTQTLQPPGQAEINAAPMQPLTATEADFPDDMMTRIAGSEAQGKVLKAQLLGAGGLQANVRWVPVEGGGIALEGVQDARARMMVERVVNTPGPYNDLIQGRLKSGPGPVTDSEAKKAGAQQPSAHAAPQKSPAGEPQKTPAKPAAAVPSQGSAGSLQAVAPNLNYYLLNGEPKK